MGKGILGIHKKIQKEKMALKRKQLKKKVEAFQEDYEKVVEKHGIALVPVLQRTPNGIFARLQPQDISEQLKNKKKGNDEQKD